MAWRRPGDKPLSQPMMVRSLTHICVTRPQRVKSWSTLILCWSQYWQYVDWTLLNPLEFDIWIWFDSTGPVCILAICGWQGRFSVGVRALNQPTECIWLIGLIISRHTLRSACSSIRIQWKKPVVLFLMHWIITPTNGPSFLTKPDLCVS